MFHNYIIFLFIFVTFHKTKARLKKYVTILCLLLFPQFLHVLLHITLILRKNFSLQVQVHLEEKVYFFLRFFAAFFAVFFDGVYRENFANRKHPVD